MFEGIIKLNYLSFNNYCLNKTSLVSMYTPHLACFFVGYRLGLYHHVEHFMTLAGPHHVDIDCTPNTSHGSGEHTQIDFTKVQSKIRG